MLGSSSMEGSNGFWLKYTPLQTSAHLWSHSTIMLVFENIRHSRKLMDTGWIVDILPTHVSLSYLKSQKPLNCQWYHQPKNELHDLTRTQDVVVDNPGV